VQPPASARARAPAPTPAPSQPTSTPSRGGHQPATHRSGAPAAQAVEPSLAVALAPQPTPTAAPAIGSPNTSHTIRISGGQLSADDGNTSAGAPARKGAGSGNASGTNAPRRNRRAPVSTGQRKLTFLLALPAILLLLPLFVLPFFGRRRYH
jgi:hypothetical protein